MSHPLFVSSDEIRSRFAEAMSQMYRDEVPQYGTLLELVADINTRVLDAQPELRAQMQASGELQRLNAERHGAIRLGTARELAMIRRVFAVMGMAPVGYYDLSVAGVPVHSTAFRPVHEAALRHNPFRVFTSLLRLELIEDPVLRATAQGILAEREIFSVRARELLEQAERDGGLSSADADEFVAETLNTFRWQAQATVTAQTYRDLLGMHRLVADVVCFRGPHINHLTPRTLDIDAAQHEMPKRGIAAKEVIEGPPRRRHPLLLRQTSFKALEENIGFLDASGTHTARFGEIEQRGMALTRKGRQRYDELLARARAAGTDYESRLAESFQDFPDDLETIHEQGLAFFSYTLTAKGEAAAGQVSGLDLQALLAAGYVQAYPIVYEDFLPVSAAGIFQSNLGDAEQRSYAANAAQTAFETDLGAKVLDEIALYEAMQQRSIEALYQRLS
ncbi:VOC family protein [Bordetella avium]|nr:VOC family protein [Bordetella avium]AZY52461.1 DUF1338 domain-containing protein [Bordetella avium]RIQ19374.1 VOC family protein [Bordetella avium]RIQ33543.1 VOC family protein [Bordetella avium]RIQ48511.1 VOC family protein [Bordetella avium]RIQ71268.1 VOC family protein [Bordetella avium]